MSLYPDTTSRDVQNEPQYSPSITIIIIDPV